MEIQFDETTCLPATAFGLHRPPRQPACGLHGRAVHRHGGKRESVFRSDIVARDIAGFSELDARLAWKLASDLELALVGRNLLHASHAEYPSVYSMDSEFEIRRSLGIEVKWRY